MSLPNGAAPADEPRNGEENPPCGLVRSGGEGDAEATLPPAVTNLDLVPPEARPLLQNVCRVFAAMAHPDAVPGRPLPERLGRYRITARLGSGSFGVVYN